MVIPSSRLRAKAINIAETIKALKEDDNKKLVIRSWAIPFFDKVLRDLEHRKNLQKIGKSENIEDPIAIRMRKPTWLNTSKELEKATQGVISETLNKEEAERLKNNLKKFKYNSLRPENKRELITVFEGLAKVASEEIENDIEVQQKIIDASTLDFKTAFTDLE